MKPNIKSLKATKFTGLTPNRDAIIEAAPNTPVKGPEGHLANRIAAALHPAKQFVKVAKIIERAEDVKSFVLVPDEEAGTKALAYFSAGQYLSVTVKVGEAVITRPYSLSSSPKEALEGRYELTVKRVQEGLISNFMLDTFQVGTKLEVSAPLGTFSYEPLRDAKHIIGIAGGSGITPFLSLAKAIAAGVEDCSLTLLYGSRGLEDSLFKEEFAAIEARTDRFKLVRVLSHREAEGCEKGFITAELIKKYAPEGQYSLFLCGPQAMYAFVDREIETLGLRRKFIRHELFGEYRNPAKDAAYPGTDRESFQVKVHICDKVQTITVQANDSLLIGMEKAGIAVPAHCRSGECGWCHSRLISGQVYTPATVDYLRLADRQYGYIHPCCAFPVSDIEIEVPKK